MPDGAPPPLTWTLQDAETCFADLVRDALARGPQAVSLDNGATVVVLAAEEYARLAPRPAAPAHTGEGPAPRMTLREVMLACPDPDFSFELPSVRSPVRDVEI